MAQPYRLSTHIHFITIIFGLFLVPCLMLYKFYVSFKLPLLLLLSLLWRFLCAIIFCSSLENRHIVFNSASGYPTFFQILL